MPFKHHMPVDSVVGPSIFAGNSTFNGLFLYRRRVENRGIQKVRKIQDTSSWSQEKGQGHVTKLRTKVVQHSAKQDKLRIRLRGEGGGGREYTREPRPVGQPKRKKKDKC